jgi:hypothetical protein
MHVLRQYLSHVERGNPIFTDNASYSKPIVNLYNYQVNYGAVFDSP